MLARALILLLAATALAGCGDDPAEPSPTTSAGPTAQAQVPQDLEFAGDVLVAADPLYMQDLTEVCAGVLPTEDCRLHAFTINDTAGVENETFAVHIELTWGVVLNDFDLYVLQDGEIVSDNVNGFVADGAEEEDIVLEPGDYEILVNPFLVVSDSYAVHVSFEVVEAEPAS